MKGRALILIFLFLVLPVCAETGEFSTSGVLSYGFTASNQFSTTDDITRILIQDAAIGDIHQVTTVLTGGHWAGNTTVTSQWDTSVNFYIDGNPIGSGILGWNLGYDGKYHIIAFLSDCDFSGLSGKKYITWTDYKYPTTDMRASVYKYYVDLPDTRAAAFVYWDSGYSRWVTIANSDNNVQRDYEFLNEYEYTFVDGYYFEMDRSSTHKSKIQIVDSGGNELVNETSFMTIPYEYWSDDQDNYTWTITNENYYGDIEIDVLNFSAIGDGGGGPDGQVWFSQNYYQFPESVQVIADLDSGSDFDKYQYFVGLTEWNGTGWQLLSTWAFLLSDTERTYTWGELEFSQSFPTVIRSYIYGYNKYTDNTETIATSTNATYTIMPGESTGQLWTDKSVYNVSEKVYIYFNTSYADNKVLVSFPHNFLIWDDSPANTINTKVLIPDIYEIGTWKIYLYESGILTNQTSIQIVGGSEIGCSWQYSDVPIGTPADFWYTSANSSAVITAWDGDGNQIYSSITDIGTYQGSIATFGREPGIYLLSMLHNGTYYNSSMEVVAYDSWIRFDSSKYYVGDTINIEYYLADPRHAISMWDAHQKLVVRFTTEHGRVVSGSMETVPFTLSENNEYSYDILGKLNSGYHTLGYWKIFIEDEYGALDDSWDEAYVCEATDDDGSYGTDTSNEMISIFFSPEGAFMLFTVCLTMMGLVLAKHPAGGGAGAVVGVGFGVYFNVLPVWMLILTVITLVVLAGVSIAVYFKGK